MHRHEAQAIAHALHRDNAPRASGSAAHPESALRPCDAPLALPGIVPQATLCTPSAELQGAVDLRESSETEIAVLLNAKPRAADDAEVSLQRTSLEPPAYAELYRGSELYVGGEHTDPHGRVMIPCEALRAAVDKDPSQPESSASVTCGPASGREQSQPQIAPGHSGLERSQVLLGAREAAVTPMNELSGVRGSACTGVDAASIGLEVTYESGLSSSLAVRGCTEIRTPAAAAAAVRQAEAAKWEAEAAEAAKSRAEAAEAAKRQAEAAEAAKRQAEAAEAANRQAEVAEAAKRQAEVAAAAEAAKRQAEATQRQAKLAEAAKRQAEAAEAAKRQAEAAQRQAEAAEAAKRQAEAAEAAKRQAEAAANVAGRNNAAAAAVALAEAPQDHGQQQRQASAAQQQTLPPYRAASAPNSQLSEQAAAPTPSLLPFPLRELAERLAVPSWRPELGVLNSGENSALAPGSAYPQPHSLGASASDEASIPDAQWTAAYLQPSALQVLQHFAPEPSSPSSYQSSSVDLDAVTRDGSVLVPERPSSLPIQNAPLASPAGTSTVVRSPANAPALSEERYAGSSDRMRERVACVSAAANPARTQADSSRGELHCDSVDLNLKVSSRVVTVAHDGRSADRQVPFAPTSRPNDSDSLSKAELLSLESMQGHGDVRQRTNPLVTELAHAKPEVHQATAESHSVESLVGGSPAVQTIALMPSAERTALPMPAAAGEALPAQVAASTILRELCRNLRQQLPAEGSEEAVALHKRAEQSRMLSSKHARAHRERGDPPQHASLPGLPGAASKPATKVPIEKMNARQISKVRHVVSALESLAVRLKDQSEALGTSGLLCLGADDRLRTASAAQSNFVLEWHAKIMNSLLRVQHVQSGLQVCAGLTTPAVDVPHDGENCDLTSLLAAAEELLSLPLLATSECAFDLVREMSQLISDNHRLQAALNEPSSGSVPSQPAPLQQARSAVDGTIGSSSQSRAASVRSPSPSRRGIDKGMLQADLKVLSQVALTSIDVILQGDHIIGAAPRPLPESTPCQIAEVQEVRLQMEGLVSRLKRELAARGQAHKVDYQDTLVQFKLRYEKERKLAAGRHTQEVERLRAEAGARMAALTSHISTLEVETARYRMEIEAFSNARVEALKEDQQLALEDSLRALSEEREHSTRIAEAKLSALSEENVRLQVTQ